MSKLFLYLSPTFLVEAEFFCQHQSSPCLTRQPTLLSRLELLQPVSIYMDCERLNCALFSSLYGKCFKGGAFSPAPQVTDLSSSFMT